MVRPCAGANTVRGYWRRGCSCEAELPVPDAWPISPGTERGRAARREGVRKRGARCHQVWGGVESIDRGVHGPDAKTTLGPSLDLGSPGSPERSFFGMAKLDCNPRLLPVGHWTEPGQEAGASMHACVFVGGEKDGAVTGGGERRRTHPTGERGWPGPSRRSSVEMR
jgi:hypothetical protein